MPSEPPSARTRHLRRFAPVGVVAAAAFLVGWWLGARDDAPKPVAPSDVELELDTDDLTLLPGSALKPPNHDPVPYHDLVPRLSPPAPE